MNIRKIDPLRILAWIQLAAIATVVIMVLYLYFVVKHYIRSATDEIMGVLNIVSDAVKSVKSVRFP